MLAWATNYRTLSVQGIDSINILSSTMPANRTFNDIGFVPLTRYPVPPTRKAKGCPPEPWPLPAFEPLQIEDITDFIFLSTFDPIDPID